MNASQCTSVSSNYILLLPAALLTCTHYHFDYVICFFVLRGRELEKLQTAATILVDQIQTDSHAAKQAQLAYDVFISYAHKNSELANRFLKLLQEKDGDVRVFFDYAELKTGVDWQRTLYDSIDATRCFVALVTQDYQASDVCNEEFNLALARCIAKVCWGGIFYLPAKGYRVFSRAVRLSVLLSLSQFTPLTF